MKQSFKMKITLLLLHVFMWWLEVSRCSILCYVFDLFRNICTYACRIFVLILGDQFDVRDFHSVILRCGAGPMSFLEQEVDEYIRQKLIK